ncbi:ABC transporter permease [Metabacillus sp. GX 13764]|uniref:ABC transporter permease n=1 Tax=Metabacillus kandeliae TaxID=2900151 RepID=UPI001E3B851E|nr:ABC transporter permease [Metabacillus kandeliae]MCD7035631.1 ABC transporter permease [Metabacillus kandeliae]
MTSILWLIRGALKTHLANKKGMWIFLGLPVIGILLSVLAHSSNSEDRVKAAVINEDGQYAANLTADRVKSLKNVNIIQVKKSDLNSRIADGTIDAAVILKKGFSKSVAEGKPAGIEIFSVKGKQATALLTGPIYEYVDVLTSFAKASPQDESGLKKMVKSYQQSSLKLVTGKISSLESSDMTAAGSIGYLIMIMLISAGSLSEFILKEKESRTYFRLLTAPIDSKSYVLANIAVNMIFMVAQIVITLFFLTNVFHIRLGLPVSEMFLILFLFSFISVGLSLIFAAFAKSSHAASALQNLIITPTCLIGGCFFPIKIMPEMLQKAADFLPQKWVLTTISQLQQGSPLGSLGLNFLILLAFAAAFFLIAVYGFSRENKGGSFV